jgi:hypothetical protein
VVICMVDGSSRCGVHRRPRCGISMPGAGAVHPIKNCGNVKKKATLLAKSFTIAESFRSGPS